MHPLGGVPLKKEDFLCFFLFILSKMLNFVKICNFICTNHIFFVSLRTILRDAPVRVPARAAHA